MGVGTLPQNALGFDCNSPLSHERAQLMVQHGYRFVVRYVRREAHHDYDLSADEMKVILAAGLALGAVQHVESAESWAPSLVKGQRYGDAAVQDAHLIGLAPGITLWCDLEGVDLMVPSATVIAYCNRWFDVVKLGGYEPGLYVGWHAKLTGTQLYRDLKFTRYWSAYNLNVDQMPIVRGVCMRQRPANRPGDIPSGSGFTKQDFDVDTMNADAKGGLPAFQMPDNV